MAAADVRDADALLVRSITRVDEALLADSRVKFVGSATIGTDHVDLDWLHSRGITFANAPGCNATSAAEYVMSALLTLHQQESLQLPAKTIGIIGCGNVGSRVMARMQAIGLRVLVCDPPRAEREGPSGFVSMQEVAAADIVSVHVPLVKQGKHATRDLINAQFIDAMPTESVFINTSRGDVVDEAALKQKLAQHASFRAILDVWNHEPLIDAELATLVDIATPHIAGYSLDGKLRATKMLHDALSQLHGNIPTWDVDSALPVPQSAEITFTQANSAVEIAAQCLAQVYDVRKDDQRLRATLELSGEARGDAFDLLRRDYPLRRECAAYRVDKKLLSNRHAEVLSAFGFAQR